MAHGGQKLFGVPNALPGGAPPMFSLFWIAGVLEFFGGLLLLLGLFTRPVAFILAGQMAVAYFMQHAPNSFWPLINQGELAVLYCFLFLYLAAAGPGPWSLDSKLRRA
jgi:putative oxidoreductase